MKIVFWWHGSTHYFNLLLSKLNNSLEFDVLYAKPKGLYSIGDGVYQTDSGANFPIFEFEEKRSDKFGYLYFVGFEEFLLEQKPDILILTDNHLSNLLYNKPLIKIIKRLKIKTVLKSIPFRINSYSDEKSKLKLLLSTINEPQLHRVPRLFKKLIRDLKIDKLYLKAYLMKKMASTLSKRKKIYNVVDAHLNYIDSAYEVYGSYGVPKEKIFVTYNSPDTDLLLSIKEKIEKEERILPYSNNRILHLSRLAEWKRVDMLILAVFHLKERFPEIELLIVGDGSEKEKLQEMARSLNIVDRVIFVGGIYDLNLLCKYIFSSSIYVLAGMGGLSINDAMTFGLPVICSVCDGTEKYLVKENYNGIYFEENNQLDLEKKISFLLNNPEIARIMGANSESIIKNEINVNTVINNYIQAFKKILKIYN